MVARERENESETKREGVGCGLSVLILPCSGSVVFKAYYGTFPSVTHSFGPLIIVSKHPLQYRDGAGPTDPASQILNMLGTTF